MGGDALDMVEALLFFAVVAAFFATIAFAAWCSILIVAAYDLLMEKLKEMR
jgi:hypothetical protein